MARRPEPERLDPPPPRDPTDAACHGRRRPRSAGATAGERREGETSRRDALRRGPTQFFPCRGLRQLPLDGAPWLGRRLDTGRSLRLCARYIGLISSAEACCARADLDGDQGRRRFGQLHARACDELARAACAACAGREAEGPSSAVRPAHPSLGLERRRRGDLADEGRDLRFYLCGTRAGVRRGPRETNEIFTGRRRWFARGGHTREEQRGEGCEHERDASESLARARDPHSSQEPHHEHDSRVYAAWRAPILLWGHEHRPCPRASFCPDDGYGSMALSHVEP